jgi:hypothetical protein
MITFSPTSGRYRDSKGRFVSQQVIGNLILEEQRATAVKLERHMQSLVDGRISTQEYSRRARAELKPSMIRMALLGAGGQNFASPQVYGAAGAQLRKVYGNLERLSQQISGGQITARQALQRSRDLSLGNKQIFNRAEQLSRAKMGQTEGWRRLDPASDHCPSCPGYATGGYVSIADIVPVGSNCECGGRCRCTVVYRFSSAPTLEVDLQTQILRNQERRARRRGEASIPRL